MYQITTLSPALIGLPPISASAVAVRRIWITGVCQRTISGTRLFTSSGLARSFANWSGNWLSPNSPPVIELRVVSLPPTRNRIRMPMRSRKVIRFVASPCAMIEITSKLFGFFARSSQNSFMYSANFICSAKRASSVRTGASGALMSQMKVSDQRIRRALSSIG